MQQKNTQTTKSLTSIRWARPPRICNFTRVRSKQKRDGYNQTHFLQDLEEMLWLAKKKFQIMRKTRNHPAKGDKGVNLSYNNIIWKSLDFILQFSCFCLWTSSMLFGKKVVSFQFYVERLAIKSTLCFSLFCKIVTFRIYLRISLMYCMNYGQIARFVINCQLAENSNQLIRPN